VKFFNLRQPARAMRASAGPLDDFWYTPTGFLVGSGQLSPERALTLSAFWKATRILSENIASFTPVKVHERLERGHRPLPDHPYTWSLGHEPFPGMDAFGYWETVMVQLVHGGNHYAFKQLATSPRGTGIRLATIPPNSVNVTKRPDGHLTYTVTFDDLTKRNYSREDIFHIRGMSRDGKAGVSLVEYASQSINGALGAENFAHRFFKQGAMAGLAAIPDRPLGPDELANLSKSVQSYLVGIENAHSVFVPPEKLALQTIGYDAEKAQILLTRQFTVEQIAHWFNLPPGMLGDSKTPTFASSQQFRQDLVDLCFRPWVERLEARIDTEMLQQLDENNPRHYFAKFEMDALLRGNAKERAEIHERGIRSGYKTRNEARLDEDAEPIEGLDEPIAALNMGTAADRPGSPERDQRIAHIVRQQAQHIVRKETSAATKAAVKFANDGPGWQTWLREFYQEHGQEVAAKLALPEPVAREYAARQGLRLAERGVSVLDDWQRTVVAELTELALSPRLEAAVNRIEEAA
jgi:HK97 family phage portal protein